MLKLVSPRHIASLSALLRDLPASKIPDFVRATMEKVARGQLLPLEKSVLRKAVESTEASGAAALQKARELYGRYGHLFYVVAPHVEALREAVGLSAQAEGELAAESAGDIRAQINWSKLDRMISLGEFHGLGVLYDPVGNLSGLLSVFDRQAMIARFADRPDGEVPPTFGVLSSRETPERLERANEDQRFGDLKDIRFGDADAFLMTVTPRVYADHFREKMTYQTVVPTAKILGDQVTSDWASSLPNEAVVLTGIKSLTEEGTTPLEHFRTILKAAKRDDVAIVDVLGYLPASKLVQEQRDYAAGKIDRLEPIDAVLASTQHKAALETALRWAGPDAEIEETAEKGVPVTVVRSTRLPRPMRLSVISDPDLIRVQEKASIDKNLQALRLGGGLFASMLQAAKGGIPWSPGLRDTLRAEYDAAMQAAENDILSSIGREIKAPDKAFLLGPIRRDLIGSWDIREMEGLYGLVCGIFGPEARSSVREASMESLKSKIRSYYSVRNPCYGFCIAADREAIRGGIGLSAAGGSMIPCGLEYPEGLQTAEQLVKRYGPDLDGLPESYREAYLLVLRLQESFYLAPELHEDLIVIGKKLLAPAGRDVALAKDSFLKILDDLSLVFVKGQSFLESSRGVLRDNGNASDFLKKLLEAIPQLKDAVAKRSRLSLKDLALLRQKVFEVLILANRFHMLPFEQHEKIARHLRLKILRLVRFQRTGQASGEVALAAGHGTKKKLLSRLIADMNRLLHHQKRAVTPDLILDALHDFAKCSDWNQTLIDLKRLQGFSARQKLLAYQAILESAVSWLGVLTLREAGMREEADREMASLEKKWDRIKNYLLSSASVRDRFSLLS